VVVLVLVAAGVLGQLEQVARRQVAGIALALHDFALGLELLDAHAGVVLLN
jgi:hypothetical protein